jgi:hypothetical protein
MTPLTLTLQRASARARRARHRSAKSILLKLELARDRAVDAADLDVARDLVALKER